MTEFRPFDESLKNETTLLLAHRYYKAHPASTDDAFLSHLLIMDSETKHAFTNTPPITRSIQDSVIELQGMISTGETSATISNDVMSLARQLLFKTCADYLTVVDGGPTPMTRILHAFALNSIGETKFDSEDVAAFSALQTLGSIVHLASSSNAHADDLWNDPELPGRLVGVILPEDGSIRRLHTKLFASARTESGDDMIPEWDQTKTVTLATKLVPYLSSDDILRTLVTMTGANFKPHGNGGISLATHDLFPALLGRLPHLPNSKNLMDIGPNTLTTVDVELLLAQLACWCQQPSVNASLPCRLPLQMEQIKTWKAIVEFINDRRTDPGVVMRVLRAVDTVRLQHQIPYLRIVYSTFKFMEKNDYPTQWLDLYAKKIDSMITDCEMQSSSCLMPVPTTVGSEAIFPSVDEEQRWWEDANRHLANRLISDKNYIDAEERLISSSGLESTKVLLEMYRKWLLETAISAQMEYITKRIGQAEEIIRNVDPYSPLLFVPSSLPVQDDLTAPVVKTDLPEPTRPATPSPLPDVPSPRKQLVTSPEPFFSPNRSFAEIGTNTAFAMDMSLLEASFHSVRSSDGHDDSFASALASPYRERLNNDELDLTPTKDNNVFGRFGKSPIGSVSHSKPHLPASPPEEPVNFIGVPIDSPASERSADTVAHSQSLLANQLAIEEAEFEEFFCGLIEAKLVVNKRRLDSMNRNITITEMPSPPQQNELKSNGDSEDELTRLRKELLSMQNEKDKIQRDLDSVLVGRASTENESIRKHVSNTLGHNRSHHPETGFCFGCQSDDLQDKALQTLDHMSEQWNLAD